MSATGDLIPPPPPPDRVPLLAGGGGRLAVAELATGPVWLRLLSGNM